jgi:hypothetical protein
VRDSAGCTWSSYDARGRATWAARQVDPDETIYLTGTSYEEDDLPDDQDRVRAESYPDGSQVHYGYSQRGLLEEVRGTNGLRIGVIKPATTPPG